MSDTKPTPFVSDEQISKRVDEYILGYRREITRVTKEFRDLYEARLSEVMREMDELRERTRWIPVSERMPQDDSEVIVLIGGKARAMATWEDSTWWLIAGIGTEDPDFPVTHWTQMPNTPPSHG